MKGHAFFAKCEFLKIDDPANDPKFGCTKPELADDPRGGYCGHSTLPGTIKPATE